MRGTFEGVPFLLFAGASIVQRQHVALGHELVVVTTQEQNRHVGWQFGNAKARVPLFACVRSAEVRTAQERERCEQGEQCRNEFGDAQEAG